jgi:hypothetical protein
MSPVLCWKIIKGQQCVTIFFQALSSFGLLCPIDLYEVVKQPFGFILVVGMPDIMQFLFGFWLMALWQFIKDIGHLVNPTSLPPAVRICLGQGFPKTEASIANTQFGTGFEPSGFKICQQLSPRQFAFTKAAINGHQLFFTVFGSADYYK